MNVNFNINKFVERFLPLHKTTTTRLKWLRFLLAELSAMWDEFYAWRQDYLYRLNVTGQTMLLQYHLNKVIEGADDSIRIQHSTDEGLYVALESEGSNYVEAGISTESGEEDDFVYVAMEGEEQESINVDFRVSVPAGVNVNVVAGEVDTYKLGGKSYEIIQN